jgi:mono/diheme cytochrome c family protein
MSKIKQRTERYTAAGMDGDGMRHLGRPVVVVLLAGLLLAACGDTNRVGTAWGDVAFGSNGERIYFTATSESGTEIDYTGGPSRGGMMMGGRLSCASCHGTDARGGVHMMPMQVMDAPDIRWETLAEHGGEAHEDEDGTDEAGYDFETFRTAVTEGRHPDGEPMSDDMPRWEISETDLADLAEYLQSFPVT